MKKKLALFNMVEFSLTQNGEVCVNHTRLPVEVINRLHFRKISASSISFIASLFITILTFILSDFSSLIVQLLSTCTHQLNEKKKTYKPKQPYSFPLNLHPQTLMGTWAQLSNPAIAQLPSLMHQRSHHSPRKDFTTSLLPQSSILNSWKCSFWFHWGSGSNQKETATYSTYLPPLVYSMTNSQSSPSTIYQQQLTLLVSFSSTIFSSPHSRTLHCSGFPLPALAALHKLLCGFLLPQPPNVGMPRKQYFVPCLLSVSTYSLGNFIQ